MELITKTADLTAFCERLSSAEFITVDTEFHRETTYWPLLCLVQVAGPDDAYCIDAMADGLDLTPLYDLFRDTSVVKVFHAARQDLEIFFHKAELIPAPLFDSQVAAMVCGFGESVGYETLVTKLTNAKIDKSQRFTDWTRRPLSEKQIDYALADVIHLRDIYVKLKAELERSNRTSWVAEEMGVLTSPATYALTPEDSWRRLKSREKKPRYLAILKEVSAWRERTAQKQNTPRRRVIKDDALIELAALRPTDEKALSQTRLSKHLARSKHAGEVIAAVKRGIETPDDQCPRLPRALEKPPGLGPVIDLLKVLLKARCEASDVALKLVATVDDLERIACDDEAGVPALSGWRRDLFGADALKLKHGELALSLSPDSKTVDVVERT
ncbi:MAG: ribonuclease D [Alphaproteobacteria bacterium]|nr:ribonuclease D [Alphaproteobacteria bacterium]